MASAFHQNDIMLTELAAFQRAEAAVHRGDMDQFKAMVFALNRLFDACLALGMPFDEPTVSEWAAIRAAQILCAA